MVLMREVTAAWTIATETESAGIKQGNHVQGTVVLVLRKRKGSLRGDLSDLYPDMQAEVQAQLESMIQLDPKDDPNFTKAPWKDAEILSPPATWKTLPEGVSLGGVRGFDDNGRPKEWPMRLSVAHWAALITDVAPGQYELRCRTIDANGSAQPMPRPFPKSGRNNIQSAAVEVS